MPYTINGIGTWYWGKKTVHARVGQCEFCNSFNELRSYETTLYFVVFYIPIIPLGKKRVINECVRCHRHRVTSLKQWEEAKTKSIDEALKSVREDPHNLDKAKTAVQTFVAYQDEPNFKLIAPVLQQH